MASPQCHTPLLFLILNGSTSSKLLFSWWNPIPKTWCENFGCSAEARHIVPFLSFPKGFWLSCGDVDSIWEEWKNPSLLNVSKILCCENFGCLEAGQPCSWAFQRDVDCDVIDLHLCVWENGGAHHYWRGLTTPSARNGWHWWWWRTTQWKLVEQTSGWSIGSSVSMVATHSIFPNALCVQEMERDHLITKLPWDILKGTLPDCILPSLDPSEWRVNGCLPWPICKSVATITSRLCTYQCLYSWWSWWLTVLPKSCECILSALHL